MENEVVPVKVIFLSIEKLISHRYSTHQKMRYFHYIVISHVVQIMVLSRKREYLGFVWSVSGMRKFGV